MRFRLTPRDEGFFPLFEAMADNAVVAADQLADLLSRLPLSADRVDTIVRTERKGDELYRTVLSRLESSIVTPFDREDIHALTDQLDDVVDELRAAAELTFLHHVTEALPGLPEMGQLIKQAASCNQRLIGKLRSLKGIQDDLDEIDRLESEGDSLHRRTVAHLFSGAFDALSVLRYKDIVEALEKALNAIESTSDIVQSIAIKHA